jgi:methionyl-tRNA formyltransferase
MKSYVLLSEKRWHDQLFENLKKIISANWVRINSKADFTAGYLDAIKPDKIFIPHWSYIIPAAIYEQFECIVFHMTDLPYGRGGSPLQNLIVRGHDKTKISAIRVSRGIDTGPVYLKGDLDLAGTVEEVFIRAAVIIEQMIPKIITDNPDPLEQEGEVVEFRRRKPDEGNIAALTQLNEVYDFIRMLDGEGYPPAFVEIGNFKIEFSRATLKGDQSILADVRITKR